LNYIHGNINKNNFVNESIIKDILLQPMHDYEFRKIESEEDSKEGEMLEFEIKTSSEDFKHKFRLNIDKYTIGDLKRMILYKDPKAFVIHLKRYYKNTDKLRNIKD
jgi:hypothetical protein